MRPLGMKKATRLKIKFTKFTKISSHFDIKLKLLDVIRNTISPCISYHK